MSLKRLRAEGKRLVTADLASGEVDRWPERASAPFVSDAERAVGLGDFDAVLDEAIASTEAYDTAIDRWVAPRIHRALPLTRREASDPAVWRYLTVVHRPDFVRHRWEHRSLSTMRSRFWSLGTRPDSNALARLWWIAELTRGQDGAYELTERVLARQPLATNIFVRELSSYRPAVAACVEVLGDEPSHVIEASVRLLNKALSTVVLETRTEADLVR
ncbi:MAG: DUF6339 family protein, partial [Polyangiales bacterium]